MSEERIVAVTGMGAVSPVGNNVPENWKNLLAGKSGIGPITKFDASNCRCRIAGEVHNLALDEHISPKEIRRMDAFCHFALVAAKEAMASSGLEEGNYEPERSGVLVSSGIGGLGTITEQAVIMRTKGLDRVSPMLVPMMISDMASGQLAIHYNMQGPNYGIVSACASALHSVGEAYWMIRRGDADIMLCGGAEAGVVELGQAAFSSMHALSERNDAPQEACRPFDKDRDGFVPAEGAGILVLEEYERAKKRGANILALVVGYGLSCDAHHITAPREDALCSSRAIVNAFNCAKLPVEQLAYVNAHGTSTPLNDRCETMALKKALGEHARKIAISSTKSMTGHMPGAAGGFESVVCVSAIQNGCVPPTINQVTPDPDCDLDYVPNQAREMAVPLALNLSFGFGGHNAAVLFKRP